MSTNNPAIAKLLHSLAVDTKTLAHCMQCTEGYVRAIAPRANLRNVGADSKKRWRLTEVFEMIERRYEKNIKMEAQTILREIYPLTAKIILSDNGRKRLINNIIKHFDRYDIDDSRAVYDEIHGSLAITVSREVQASYSTDWESWGQRVEVNSMVYTAVVCDEDGVEFPKVARLIEHELNLFTEVLTVN